MNSLSRPNKCQGNERKTKTSERKGKGENGSKTANLTVESVLIKHQEAVKENHN